MTDSGSQDLTGNDILKFGVESKRSSSSTSTLKFMDLIAESLRDMRVICSATIGKSPVGSRL